MLFVYATFWVVLWMGREELGFKGIAWAVAAWLGLVAGYLLTSEPALHGLFTFSHALLDGALILIVFGRDIKIR